VPRADNLTTFMCQLSGNLGDSTSWSPKGLSRPVMGLLCLYREEGSTPIPKKETEEKNADIQSYWVTDSNT
jgi:hypothetical protein